MTVETTDTTMREMGRRRSRERISVALLAVSALCALGLVLLSFMPWVTFTIYVRFVGPTTTSSLDGIDLTGMSGFGDGYLVAALAAIAAVLAARAILLPSERRLSAVGVAVSGLTSFGVALYDAVHDWGVYDPGTLWGNIYEPSQDLTDIAPALWATLMLSATLGLAGLTLTLLHERRRPEPEVPEVKEAWA